MFVPDLGNAYTFNPGDTPVGIPELDYYAYFVTNGTFTVWVRGSGDSDAAGQNDSINLGVDGVLAYRINGEFPQAAGYAWGGTNPVPAGATFTVSTPGYHVINAWMREDGFGFDKMVIASNPSYTPTGLGPTESPVLGVASGFRVTLTRSGADLILSWAGGGTLQSSTNVVGTYVDMPGSNSPVTIVPTGAQKYYRVRQ